MKNYKYEVHFDHANSGDWFYTRIYWLVDGDKKILVGNKSVCKNYKRAAKWAKKQIRKHDEANTMLNGALKP